MTKTRVFCTILVIFFTLSACKSTRFDADIAEYGDAPITIAGLTEEEFTVTPNELSRLDCVTRSATGKLYMVNKK
jgi:hypothetical protein